MTEQRAERPKQRRRFLKWIVIALLLSPLWYAGAWLLMATASAHGYIPFACEHPVAVAFRPMTSYASSDRWGAESLRRIYCHVNWNKINNAVHLSPVPSEIEESQGFGIGELCPIISVSMYREIKEQHDARRKKRVNDTPSPPTETSPIP